MGVCVSVAFFRVFYGRFTARYKIDAQIGEGAFGDVFKCTKRETNEEFAVKRIEVASSEETWSQALKEDGICQLLHHENVVFQEEPGMIEQGFFHMVFELIRGDTLFRALSLRMYYCERDALSLMYQLSSAIAYCHSINIIHRDVKSENTMLRTEDNRLKLIDFGLATRASDDSRKMYGGYGTPGYIAPEILQLQPYGKPVDIWSCGVLFYNLLSGVHPFHSTNEVMLQQLAIACRWRYAPEQFEGITHESIDLINAMTRSDQNSRPTAADVVRRLQQLRDRADDVIDESRMSIIFRFQRWKPGVILEPLC